MLTPAQHRMLEFEERYEHTPTGRKLILVRAEFGLTITQYYQRVRVLIYSPDALAAFPQLVYRWLAREERRAG